MLIPQADEARNLAMARSDDLFELREKIGAAIAKAIEEERFEARVRINDDIICYPADAVTEITNELTAKGYVVTQIMVTKTTRLLLINYKGICPQDEIAAAPVAPAPQIDYKGIELPETVAPTTREV